MATYLVGDIGGTNSRFSLQQDRRVLSDHTYPSRGAHAPSLEALLQHFLTKHCDAASPRRPRPTVAVLAVAGPVQPSPNTGILTNIPEWPVIDAHKLQKALGVKDVIIINDFQAIGLALPALQPEHLVLLSPGVKPRKHGVICCLGPGTGLGECFLTWNAAEGVYDVHPTEGGHADFAPHNRFDMGLVEHILNSTVRDAETKEKFTRVDAEAVLSGPGLYRLWSYLASQAPASESAAVRAQLQATGAKDLAPVAAAIISKAAQQGDKLAKRTFELFVHYLGAEGGNYALKTLPYGGLYIAGGIPPKNLEYFQKDGAFMKSFLAKQPHESLLKMVPVYVVTHPAVGLFGAATLALQHHAKEQARKPEGVVHVSGGGPRSRL